MRKAHVAGCIGHRVSPRSEWGLSLDGHRLDLACYATASGGLFIALTQALRLGGLLDQFQLGTENVTNWQALRNP